MRTHPGMTAMSAPTYSLYSLRRLAHPALHPPSLAPCTHSLLLAAAPCARLVLPAQTTKCWDLCSFPETLDPSLLQRWFWTPARAPSTPQPCPRRADGHMYSLSGLWTDRGPLLQLGPAVTFFRLSGRSAVHASPRLIDHPPAVTGAAGADGTGAPGSHPVPPCHLPRARPEPSCQGQPLRALWAAFPHWGKCILTGTIVSPGTTRALLKLL